MFAEEICAEYIWAKSAKINSAKKVPHKFLPQTISSLKVIDIKFILMEYVCAKICNLSKFVGEMYIMR